MELLQHMMTYVKTMKTKRKTEMSDKVPVVEIPDGPGCFIRTDGHHYTIEEAGKFLQHQLQYGRWDSYKDYRLLDLKSNKIIPLDDVKFKQLIDVLKNDAQYLILKDWEMETYRKTEDN